MRKIVAAVFLFATACHLGPSYAPPETENPSAWKAPGESGEGPTVENWWEAFRDKELSALEKQVVEKNPDLYVALQKVAAARGVAGIAKSELYPQIYLKPGFNNIYELIKLYGVPQGFFPALKTVTRVHELSYQLPVAMTYEVDLWGKYRGVYNAAKIYAEAQDEAARATWLTLTSDLASNYFNARSLDTQLELLQLLVSLRQKALNLTRLRFQAGLVSALDLMQSEQIFSNTDAELQDTLRQRAIFENAIAVLIGCPASSFHLDARPIRFAPPEIPAGLPSEILLRRPDVAQAERSMAGFHALIGVAYATYFPNIELTSQLGFSSPVLSQFLTWAGRLLQIGVNLAQVLYNGGRNAAYVDAAMARFEEAKGSYENIVLRAFQEVEDALTNVEQEKKQFDALQDATIAAKETSRLTILRYQKGVANLLDTINAQQNAIDAERTWVNALGNRYQASIQLIKALGGGWDVEESAVPETEDSSCQSTAKNSADEP